MVYFIQIKPRFGVKDMHDVFISYSHKDQKVTELISQKLEQRGVSCWYAPRDIAPGMDWREAIIRAISDSKVFILVYSKYSNQSRQVLNEVTAAFDASCVIIPFRIDDEQMSPALSYYLSNLHWMDATDLPRLARVDELCGKVTGILGTAPMSPLPVKKTPAIPRKPGWIAAALAIILTIAGLFPLFRNLRTDTVFADDPEAIEQACESVVQIELWYQDQLYGGMGFACFREDIIVTNAYAVPVTPEILQQNGDLHILIKTESGTTLVAREILAIDKELGIAFLSTSGNHELPLLRLGSSEQLQRGSKMAVLGHHVIIGEYMGLEDGYLMFSEKGEIGGAGSPLMCPDGTVAGTMHLTNDKNSYAIPAETIQAMWESIS